MTDLLHPNETPDEPMDAATDTTSVEELREMRAELVSDRADVDETITRLAKDAIAPLAPVRADYDAKIAQIDKRIITRMAADAAGEIEILTSTTPPQGDAPWGSWGNPFCNSPHPTDRGTSCKRIAGHDGDHAAYTFRLSAPETWPAADAGDDQNEPTADD